MTDMIRLLSDIRANYNCMDESEEPYYRALSEAIRLASERKRGKWIRVSADKYRISAGYAYMCDKCGDTTWYNGNFCSHCGADMREDDNVDTV